MYGPSAMAQDAIHSAVKDNYNVAYINLEATVPPRVDSKYGENLVNQGVEATSRFAK